MTIFVVWEKPRRELLHIVYRPGWTYDDFERAREKARQMLDEAPRSVDLVIDQQMLPFDPDDFLLHAQLLSEITMHPKARRIIMLGVPQELVPPRTGSGRSHNPLEDYQFAPTMDEVYALLMRNRQ